MEYNDTRTTKIDFQGFKRIGSYLKPYGAAIGKILAMLLFSNFAMILGPFLISYVIDTVIPNQDTNAIIWITVFYTTVSVLNAGAIKYRIYHITKLGQDVLRDIRSDLFNHMQKLGFRFFDSRPHGKILTRVVNYINALSNILSSGLITVISDILSIVVTLAIMLSIDVVLTLYSFILLPVLFAVTMIIKNKQRLAYEELSAKQSNLNAYIHESIEGIKTTQSYTREGMNFDIFADVSNQQSVAWMKAVRAQFILGPIVQVISVVTISFIYFAGVRGLGVDVSTGVLIAFVAYVTNFWNPIINLGNFYNSLVSGTVYLERVFEMMDLEPMIKDAPDAFDMPPVRGEVLFENVTFGYKEGQNIFEGLSFKVNPGETIALVGPTGAGKSTITNL
ncbi:ABC transporter ATP-binding protein, partial [Jeotgalibaca porci]